MARTTIQNTQYTIRDTKYVRQTSGSALILAVVLTSLLAVIGVAFLLSSRIDSIATSALAENKELNLAVDTVIAKISEQLVVDTPGITADEYYDYPDSNNSWLASLEPEVDNSFVPPRYFWRKISDIYESPVNPAVGLLDWLDADPNNWTEQAYFGDHVSAYNLRIQVIPDSHFVTGATGIAGTIDFAGPADADGDGVADSRWIRLPDMTSGKGKPIYAAVRVIDNSAMLNVNTAYKFDPNDPNLVDGSSQLHVNLVGLSFRGGTPDPDGTWLTTVRSGMAEPGDPNYEQDVLWNYEAPKGRHTPFDISDEMKLRNRYLLNHQAVVTRIEEFWDLAFDGGDEVPRTADVQLTPWFFRANNSSLDPNYYDYRHIATINNMDRIIKPGLDTYGYKMFNINIDPRNRDRTVWDFSDSVLDRADYDFSEFDSRDKALELYETIRDGVYGSLPDDHGLVLGLAQWAANVVDMRDGDVDTTVLDINFVGRFYGFDCQPYFSEIGVDIDAEPETGRNYYAVELYNPFDVPIELSHYSIELYDSRLDEVIAEIVFTASEEIAAGGAFVVSNDPDVFGLGDPNTTKLEPLLELCSDWACDPNKSKPVIDPRWNPRKDKPPVYACWNKPADMLFLKKRVAASEEPNDTYMIYVDRQPIDCAWASPGVRRFFARAADAGFSHRWHIAYQELAEDVAGSLGFRNPVDVSLFSNHNFSFFLPSPVFPDADPVTGIRPLIQEFVTVGDIPRVLSIGNNTLRNHTIGQQLLDWDLVPPESAVRINLKNPANSNIFQYLTVFDPTLDSINNDGDPYTDESFPDRTPEFKVLGRINVNTAPWFVLAQLPWVSPEIAQAIVAYRDKTVFTTTSGQTIDYTSRSAATGVQGLREEPGFASIGELNFAAGISKYAQDGADISHFPDLTAGDMIIDDFEERDIIFSRVSNLVTVRSDLFTVYILVRIGRDGPQKRVISILDRSEVYPSSSVPPLDRVRIRAIHPVPDPR